MSRQRSLCALFVALAMLIALPAAAQDKNQRKKTKTTTRGVTLEQPDEVKQLPEASKRYALVIGVDKYDDTQISTLGGASNDARTLRDALISYAGFPADQTILLASDQPAERQPTRGNILRRLSNFAAAIPKDGLLLVSFAGHGMEREGRAYLLPKDAEVSNDIYLLEQTAINVQQMHELIKRTGVQQVLILLDACRNDPAGRANADNPLTPSYTRSFNFDVRNKEVKAFATIYATDVGKRAYEYKERQQGYFTWAVVEGLKGAAANERGEITLASLVSYLQERVPKLVSLDLGVGKDQKPFAEIGGYRADELVLAVTPQAATQDAPSNKTAKNRTANAQSRDVSRASMPNAATVNAAVELSFWDTIKNSPDPEDFKEYLEKYPKGQFAALARKRIARAESSKPQIEMANDSTSNSARMSSSSASTNAAALKTSSPAPLTPVMSNRYNMEFTLIPAGSFTMGSTRFDRETPVRKVTISKPFYIAKYLVTQAQWQAIMSTNPSYAHGQDYPVDNVSWNEVQEFIRKLNEIENDSGFIYRLPTEAEWEYACRLGLGKESPDVIDLMAWHDKNSSGRTHPIGQRQANSLGLYDMLGNVWQWTWDYYHEGYENAPTDGSEWLIGGDQQYHVLRGGSFYDPLDFATPSYRGRAGSDSHYNNIGFRLVAVPRQ